MSQVLVDTSVWIDMFRKGESAASQTLGQLLSLGLVCTHGIIRAEILSGTRSKIEYQKLADYLSALTLLQDPPELWDNVALARYRLARGGFQASIADLVVAASASYHAKAVFTLDQSFRKFKKVLSFELLDKPEHFQKFYNR